MPGYSNPMQKPIPIPSTRIRFRYSVLVTWYSNRIRLVFDLGIDSGPEYDLGTDSASEYDSNTEFESDSNTEYRNRTQCRNRTFGVGVLESDSETDSDTEYRIQFRYSVFGMRIRSRNRYRMLRNAPRRLRSRRV